MGGEDFRTKPLKENEYTYYVFDNLRCNQDHAGGNVFRYDTVEEAIDAFRRTQSEHPDWTIALGGSINGTREIDYIQRRNGDNCLITDYQKLDAFKTPEALHAIEAAVVGLRVDWQVDHELTGASILVPHELGECPMDSYLFGMQLRPTNPDNVLTSVQEIFVEGGGWVELPELRELACFANDEKPQPPKVTAFNVAYKVRDPHSTRTGYVDISPSNFRVMKQEYQEIMREKEIKREANAPEIKTMGGWRDMISEAKEKATTKNLDRPEKQRLNSHDLER